MADETILDQNVLTAAQITDPSEFRIGVERFGFSTPYQLPISELKAEIVDPVDADLSALEVRVDAAEAQLLTLALVPGQILSLDSRVTVLEGMPQQVNVVDSVADLAGEFPISDSLWQTSRYWPATDVGANLYRYDATSVAAVDGGWVINGPGGVGRYLAVDRSVANVRHFGAVGDGVADDTAAIQAAMAVADATGAGVFVPAGFYVITSTIQTPDNSGFAMRGVGRVGELYALPNAAVKGSVFIWQGAAGGTMLQWRCSGAELDGITLWGKKSGDATQAGVGLNITAVAGIGTGHSIFPLLAIHDCDRGIAATGSTNEADNWFGLIRIRNCATSIYLDNAQSVNWVFGYLTSQNTTNVFEVNAGGLINVQHVFCYNVDRIFKLTGTAAGTGSLNGSFRFGMIAIDGGGQTIRPTFVEVTQQASGGRRLIEIGGIRQSNWSALADNTPQFILKGDTQCFVRQAAAIDMNKKVFEMEAATNAIPSLFFEGCKLITPSFVPYVEATYATISTLGTRMPTYEFNKCTRSLPGGSHDGRIIGDFGNSGANLEQLFTSGDATPSVQGLHTARTSNGAATTITGLDDGHDGQTITILFGDPNTTVDFTGTTLKGNGGADWTPANGDHMVCTRIAGNWYCQISDNTA